MATRNLTRNFKKQRDMFLSRRRPRYGAGAGADGAGDLLGSHGGHQAWDQARNTLPPHWVDSVDEIKFSIDHIEQKIDKLHEAHRNRLLVRFDDSEGHQDREIDKLTKQITKQFREAEVKLKRVGDVSGMGATPQGGQSDLALRKNIQRSLAVQLQRLSMSFRKSQKEYLARLKSQKGDGDFGDLLGTPDLEERAGFEAAGAAGFTEEQVVMLERAEDQVEERDQEIQKIASSIQELAEIFKELAVLVIDQGTILDRIDYNMESVVDNVEKGHLQLEKAEKYSRSTRPLKCMGILVILIIILTIILVLKHS